MDGYPEEPMISMCWAFTFWRLQHHGKVEQLCEEVNTAFPWLQAELPESPYLSKQDEFKNIIKCRLINRFMVLFGFAIVDPRCYKEGKKTPTNLTLLPLFYQVVKFDI